MTIAVAVGFRPTTAAAISGSTDMGGIALILLTVYAIVWVGAVGFQIGLGLSLLDTRGQRWLWVCLALSPLAVWLVGMLPWVDRYSGFVTLAPLPLALWLVKRPRAALVMLLVLVAVSAAVFFSLRFAVEHQVIWPVATGQAVLSLPLAFALLRRARQRTALLLPPAWFALAFALVKLAIWLA